MPSPHEGLIAVVGENMQPQPGANFRQVVTGGPRPIAGGPTDADCHFKWRHRTSSLYASGNNIRRIILRYCCRGKGRVLVLCMRALARTNAYARVQHTANDPAKLAGHNQP